MFRVVALVALALALPSASAGPSVGVSSAMLLDAPHDTVVAGAPIDADRSFVPDAIEPEVCGIQGPSPGDGSCNGNTYSPPAPLDLADADADGVPDANEGQLCGGPALPTFVGTCDAGQFTPSAWPILHLELLATNGASGFAGCSGIEAAPEVASCLGLNLTIDLDRDGAHDVGETLLLSCDASGAACTATADPRRATVCTSNDAPRLLGCLADTDRDGRLLHQEIVACSDPTDPATPSDPAGDPTRCQVIPQPSS